MKKLLAKWVVEEDESRSVYVTENGKTRHHFNTKVGFINVDKLVV